MGVAAINLVGQVFGKLTVIERAGAHKQPNGNTQALWLCKCFCGQEKTVQGRSLRAGLIRSCSCLQKENRLKHGHARRGSPSFPRYRSFHAMKNRCLNPNNKNYPSYGGRGIEVCDRWLGPDGFTNFLADVGERPTPKHSIDRINNDGNYEATNCRWATQKEQNNNRRCCSAKNKTAEQVAA
jgi:hypothetical protein